MKNNLNTENNDLMLNETLFHNANGYLGVRSNYEEGYPEGYQTIRGEYINGFYDYAEMKQAEKLYGLVEEKQTMPNLVDTQGIRLWIEDEEFSMFQGSVIKSTRTLDMRRGVTQRYVIWQSPHGRKIEIKIRRMASFLLLPLFTIEYSMRPLNFSGKLHMRSTHIGNVKNYFDTHDPRLAGEENQHIRPGQTEYLDGISIICSRTLKSDLSITSAVKNILSVPAQREYKLHGSTISEEFYVEGVCKNSLRLTKYTVLCDSIRYPNCRKAALECMKQAVSVPLAVWYEKQENYLNKYWKNCALHIRGDRELSVAITYNLYQLIQSAGRDPHCSVAAKGLSGEGYEGHYFWDTEMFLSPFYSLTMPELARNLIEYRYATLDFARKNARILGHQSGALFPWRTIMGKECSGYFPAGSAQYHINGAIAYSIINYYLLTNDLEFIEKCGAEIVFETARLWIDLGNYRNGKFVMNDVTGPDEYTCIVNNNYYTNLLAQFNLSWAVKLYKILREAGKMETIQQKLQLKVTEINEFKHAAQAMYLPYDSNLDINPQDDSFLAKKALDLKNIPETDYPLLMHYHPLYLYRHQVCKQADTVLAYFILEDAQSTHTMKNSFKYYEKITTHDSSLSACIFSIMASRLGMREKAYTYFHESAVMDINDTYGNTKDGIHTADMGGTYMAVVYGFGGLRVKEDGLYFTPSLPDPWDAYDFKVHYVDSLLKIEVKNCTCVITLLSGTDKMIHVYGEPYQLRDKICIPIKAVEDMDEI